MNRNVLRMRRMLLMLGVFVVFSAVNAFAAGAAGAGTLPWDTSLSVIGTSITGPAAYWIGLLGMAIAFGTLIFGGDLNHFARVGSLIGLAVAGLVTAAPMMARAFGVAGAIV